MVDIDRLKMSLLLKIATVTLEILKADHALDLTHLLQLKFTFVTARQVQSSLHMPQC